MADAQPRFVSVWGEWAAKFPIPARLPASGTVRRLDVGTMMGRNLPTGAKEGQRLLESIAKELKAALAERDGALFWSPGPGAIDVFYPKLLPVAADLVHSVLATSVERLVRSQVAPPATTDEVASPTESRVDWETFQRLCRREKARQDQILTIDVSAHVLGRSDPNAHLSRRSWRIVDEITDEFLASGGYCTRCPGNRILIFIPGLSATMASARQHAIESEIEEATGALRRGEDAQSAPAANANAEEERETRPRAARAGSKAEAKAAKDADAEEIANLNRAFAAMAAAQSLSGLSAAELAVPDSIALHKVPMWRASNQTLVGYTVTARPAGAYGEFTSLGVDPASLDLPILSFAQASVVGLAQAESPCLMIVPVHWRTLERWAFREKYLELAARAPEEVRRFIVLSLCEVPEDLMGARIVDVLRDLRRFSRSQTCQVSLNRRNFDQFVGVGIHAIGTDLTAAHALETVAMADMNAFLDALEPLKVQSSIAGLRSKSLVISALAAGFDYLSGPAITTEAGITGARSLSITDLYQAADENPAAAAGSTVEGQPQ